MSERSAILNVILEKPDDDTARLVLADLLRESDDAGDQARGRFLWAGVTASRFRNDELIEDPLYYSAQMEISAVAGAGELKRWLLELGIGAPLPNNDWGWDCQHDRVTMRLGERSALFSRGMLSDIGVTLDEWYSFGKTILQQTPLEKVAIIDVNGLSFAIEPGRPRWSLKAHLKLPAARVPLMGWPTHSIVAPSPVLVQAEAEWHIDELFRSRTELVERVKGGSMILTNTLRDLAGNRWPGPR